MLTFGVDLKAVKKFIHHQVQLLRRYLDFYSFEQCTDYALTDSHQHILLVLADNMSRAKYDRKTLVPILSCVGSHEVYRKKNCKQDSGHNEPLATLFKYYMEVQRYVSHLLVMLIFPSHSLCHVVHLFLNLNLLHVLCYVDIMLQFCVLRHWFLRRNHSHLHKSQPAVKIKAFASGMLRYV